MPLPYRKSCRHTALVAPLLLKHKFRTPPSLNLNPSAVSLSLVESGLSVAWPPYTKLVKFEVVAVMAGIEHFIARLIEAAADTWFSAWISPLSRN